MKGGKSMTALHVSIKEISPGRFNMTCDNLRREDANDREVAMANAIESVLGETVKALASDIILYDKKQDGMAASEEHIRKDTA
jgi:hypothetical protein